MRKSRGLTKDTKRWVYGYYIKIKGKNCIVTENAHFGFVDIDILKKEADLRGGWYEIVPETVGQFTGLHDKNGKEIREIWEGDIYQGKESGIILVVEFQEGQYILTKKVDYAPHRIKHADLHYALNNLAIKHIGDIHSSPELLEEQDNGKD